MHRTQFGNAEFSSECHEGILKQIIKLLGFRFHTRKHSAYGIKWETFIINDEDVYKLCDKLELLGWKRS